MSLSPDSLQLGKPTRCFLSWIFCALVAVVACYVKSTNIVEPFEYVFPKRSTCYYKKFSKNHQCGFIHAFKHLMLSICSYIESSWMDYLQCGFFHVSSNGLMLNIFCHWEQLNGSSPVWVLSCLFKSGSHTGSNWMIYHCCGSFQVSPKCLMLNIFCHSESSWMVYHQCGFSHGYSNFPFVRMFCHNSCKGISWHVSSWLHNWVWD